MTLAAANIEAEVLAALPEAVRVAPVETARELHALMRDLASETDVLIMAAAVADFRPVNLAAAKIKKRAGEGPAPIELVENPDILGFGAETGDEAGSVLDHGRAKARRKGADLLAVNEVGATAGFGDVPNSVTVLDAEGEVVGRAAGTKDEVAEALVALIAELAVHRLDS